METGARIVIVFAETMRTARSVASVRDVFAAEGVTGVVLLVSGGPFAADSALAREVGANGVVAGAEAALRIVSRAARDLAGGGAEA